MEEDTLSCNIGDGDHSSSIPVDVEEYESFPTPSSTYTQNPTHFVPSLAKKPKKASSNQSVVWEYFTKVEPIDCENSKAQCNYCAKLFNCHYKNSTSFMMHHLYNACETSPLRIKRVEKSQTLSVKRDAEGRVCSPQGLVKYDSEKLKMSTAKFFIRCELPFRLVEDDGFIEFMVDVESRFTLPSQITLQRDCIKLYHEEKIKLKKLLGGQRICLTTDTWTSVQNMNYMCITAHFIDCNWRLHKKILKFCQIPKHKGKTIRKILDLGLHEWGIDKILTITIDNAFSNVVPIDYMSKRIKENNCIILGGEFLHVQCAAHILNLIVMDGLKDVYDFVARIRDVVRHVKSSPSRFAKFKACAVKENIGGRMICLDVPTRWNSTYLMLSIAEKHQQTFEQYVYEDSQFVNPTCDDWKNAQIFVELLKIFYEVTLNISDSLYVTANVYFQELCIIEDVLNDMCE